MKAAIINQFGTPEVLQIAELPIPEINENQVLIKVHAASVNPVDWKHRYGNHKLILGSDFPICLGYDVSGVVEKVGSSVKSIKKGDEIYGRVDKKYGGTYAQYAISSEAAIAIKPSTMSFDEAAAVPLAAITALQALRDKGNIQKGMNILILGGSSGVGHFAVQIANYFGCSHTVVSGPNHENIFKKIGVQKHINYKETDFHLLNDKFDIIFDVVGHDSYRTCKHLLKPKGSYINTLPRPKILAHKVLALFSKGKKVKSLLMKSTQEDLNFIREMIENNKLLVHIDKTFSLDETKAAHEYSETGKTEGKLVIKIA